ncbi:hypothetical protein HYS93_01510 [Candidatus Daviesbacteria bacterium]|nr:hypothetical protein [Candidatus Daviesbacteria bacterium]
MSILERKILPSHLFKHYVEGRTKAYAGGGEDVYNPDPNLLGFKVFRWTNPDLPYHFEDHYTDNPQRPGNFGGFEINRESSEYGGVLSFYDYNGGLTNDGMRLGEVIIYPRLIRFLGEHVEVVRFGKNVVYTIEDESGNWVYQGIGEIEAYGWYDEELITNNGLLVYKLRGSGICFIPES